MPRFDGTGPCGKGPSTGMGRGNCKKVQEAGCRSVKGCGRGRLFGSGNSMEGLALNEKIEILKSNKKRIEQELKNLEIEQNRKE